VTMAVHGHMNRPQTQEITRRDGKKEIVQVGGSRESAKEFKWGIIVTGVGALLLILSETSKGEKAGYNF